MKTELIDPDLSGMDCARLVIQFEKMPLRLMLGERWKLFRKMGIQGEWEVCGFCQLSRTITLRRVFK